MPLIGMKEGERQTIGGNGAITLQKELQLFICVSHDENSVLSEYVETAE